MQCHYLLLLLATASANKLRLRAKQFQKWRDARFGCGNRWHYWRCSGQLTDPATGVVIARLEGVEATRDAVAAILKSSSSFLTLSQRR